MHFERCHLLVTSLMTPNHRPGQIDKPRFFWALVLTSLFALGILGVGMIGVPVLAGSAAYALAEAMGWKWGMERKATDARGFYSVIAISVLIGMILEYTPINPMKALFWSAVINGIVAVPLLGIITHLASSNAVMGSYAVGMPIRALGWCATGIMGLAAIAMWVL